jgi:TonB family protein
MRQNAVDQKAKLLTTFEPRSNQFAQDKGVAGMALYHVIIGVGGKPEQIAVARPIGFGLDENAVEAILNAKFEPAVKDGKPVPVLLDLVVQFRIYSKRTAMSSASGTSAEASGPVSPGPYSNQQP